MSTQGGVKRKRASEGGGAGGAGGAGAGQRDADAAASKNARRRTLVQNARHIDVAPLPAQASTAAAAATAATTTRATGSHGTGAGAGVGSTSGPSGTLKLSYQPTPAVLPARLDLAAHIQARSYQLAAFQRALLSARTAANARAWQLLPRHARRRAASHNLLRIPKRMRIKAAAELKASKTLALRKAQIRRRFGDDTPLSRARKRTAILLLRAAANAKLSRGTSSELKSNTVSSLARASKSAADRPSHWLETHLWHTKRFHISSSSRSHPKHGRDMGAVQRAEAVTHAPFALAYRPHMKGHRAAIRASLQQCTLRDVSWWANVRLCVRVIPTTPEGEAAMDVDSGEGASTSSLGEQARRSAMQLLRDVGARDGWQQEWMSGARMCYTTLLGTPASPTVETGSKHGKGKARQMDERPESELRVPLCHALYPLNIVWLPNGPTSATRPTHDSIKTSSSRSSRQRKSIRDQAAAANNSAIDGRPSAGKPGSSTSKPASGLAKAGMPADDDDDMDAMMNAQADEEDDMDAYMNAQEGEGEEEDEDVDAEDDGREPGAMPASGMEAGRPRRKYRRSRKKKKKKKGGKAKSDPHLRARSAEAEAEAEAEAAAENSALILLQSHPACIPHLLRTLRQTASSASSSLSASQKAIVEIQELSVAPSAGVAVGRGRAALQPDSGRQGNVGALLRKVETEKKKGQERGRGTTGGKARSMETDVVVGTEGQGVEGFNAFELIGPEAGRLLVGVLKPVARMAQVKLDALNRLVDPEVHSHLPTGWVLSLDVHDPRLSFPPKLPKRSEEQKKNDGESGGDIAMGHVGVEQDDGELASGRLFREGGSLPKFSKGTIDKRRAKSLIPGTPLKPTADDDIVPIVIIQRSLTSTPPIAASATFPLTSGAAQNERDGTAMQGFTLLVPRGWGSAFFHSLSYPSPTPVKVIGLSQARQQVLESGTGLSFPHDWAHAGPAAAAATQTLGVARGNDDDSLFGRWAKVLGEEEWKEWVKRPPAKRENWAAKGVRWPFGPVFKAEGMQMEKRRVEKGQEREREKKKKEEESMWMVFVRNAVEIARSAGREGTELMGGAGALLASVLQDDSDQSGNHQRHPWLCCIRSLSHALAISTTHPDPVWARQALPLAFVPVRLQACRKGIFGQWAEIHVPATEEEGARWRAVLEMMENDRRRGEAMIEELGAWMPPASEGNQTASSPSSSLQPRSTHVGTVTSGDYALTQGRGFAIGVLPLVAWLELCAREPASTSSDDQDKESTKKKKKKKKKKKRNAIAKQALVFVRERTSEMYRLASAEVLVP
ncbi:hypothetical protein A4X06_0g696 [Tilletia controversa]|uniref:Uncharacterized protein n=1 Tax=Tilletia controversa TaxID=13291 RepID=A0A8X7MZL3_9BASI|nr:hypothetical protein CF328_g597 [Tilletia controversa]KAE8254869.1 hypothetical protein A4X06_0g696 [Tilletia controversa]